MSKQKIDNTSENIKCRSYRDRDDTVNNINKCSKIVQKEYMKKQDWVIQWELFKRIKFDLISQMVRVFANGPGDQGSIPGRVIPKTQKMVLDVTLLNTQHYKGMD